MFDKAVDYLMRLLGIGVKKVEDKAAADRAESEEIHKTVQAANEEADKVKR